MRIKNLEGTLATRARDAGRAIDNQWIYENEVREFDSNGLTGSLASSGTLPSNLSDVTLEQIDTMSLEELEEFLARSEEESQKARERIAMQPKQKIDKPYNSHSREEVDRLLEELKQLQVDDKPRHK